MHSNSSQNKKTLLCRNIVLLGNCTHAAKCIFAHNLNEQIQHMSDNRKKLFNTIINKQKLAKEKN